MGTWGFNILDDDTTRDVYDDYMEAFNAKVAPDDIMRELEAKYPSAIGDDEDDGPLFVLAVAKAQWDCGHLRPETIAMVKRIVDEGLGLENWEDEGPKVLAKRKAKVAAFLQAIQTLNPKPRKPKAPTQRKPPFEAGDCLAMRLSDGEYGAVLVLAAEWPNPDPRKESHGTNVVGVLKYKSATPPTRADFVGRAWLHLTHHSWGKYTPDGKGCPEIVRVSRHSFKSVAATFQIVDRVELFDTDPRDSRSYTRWEALADQVMRQDRWDRGFRDD